MGNTTDFDRLPEGDPKRRQYVRFDPTFQVGAIVEIAVIVFGIGLAWATLKSDQQSQRADIETIKKAADKQELATKETLQEIKSEVREVQRTLNQALRTLDVIDARQTPQKGKP